MLKPYLKSGSEAHRTHLALCLAKAQQVMRSLLPVSFAIAVSCMVLGLTSCIASRGQLLGPVTITSFTASPTASTPGQPVVLTWSVSGATSIAISDGTGPVSAATALTGNSIQVTPSATTTYTLTAVGSGQSVSMISDPQSGATRPATATVTVVPGPVILNFAATPSAIALGQSTSLNWSVQNDQTLTLQALDPATNRPLGNEIDVTNATLPLAEQPTQDTTYVLTATSFASTGLSAQAEVTVTVQQVPLAVIDSFAASNNDVGIGQAVTLTWSVEHTVSLALLAVDANHPAPGISVPVSGTSTVVTPQLSTTYTLVATNTAGVTTSSQPISVRVSSCTDPRISSFAASPVSIGAGSNVSLTAVFDGNSGSDPGVATIDNGIGTVTSGSQTPTPPLNQTTTYTLSVTNTCGSQSHGAVRVPVGSTSLFAGQSSIGNSDGVGGSASFYAPSGLAVDGTGNLYVADASNNTIRMIDVTGSVTTIAGTPGVSGLVDGTGGPNGTAQFNIPLDVAIDAAGNLYVADYGNNAIRVIAAGTRNVTTVAGSPTGASGYQDGTGSAALFAQPEGVAVDGAGNVYVAEYRNNTIRRIAPGGVVTTLAGPGPTASNGGGAGYADGTGSSALFVHPNALTLDAQGNLFVSDEGNFVVRKVTPSGVVTTIAGTPKTQGSNDGLAGAAGFGVIKSITIDADGRLYLADSANYTMRRLSPTTDGYLVETIIGTAKSVSRSPSGPLPGVFGAANGVAADPTSGRLYSSINNAIFVSPY